MIGLHAPTVDAMQLSVVRERGPQKQTTKRDCPASSQPPRQKPGKKEFHDAKVSIVETVEMLDFAQSDHLHGPGWARQRHSEL
jgi:hypothetical protein